MSLYHVNDTTCVSPASIIACPYSPAKDEHAPAHNYGHARTQRRTCGYATGSN